jgi:hypothetical protein
VPAVEIGQYGDRPGALDEIVLVLGHQEHL